MRHKYMVRDVKRAAEFGIKARKFEVCRPLRGLVRFGVDQPRVTPSAPPRALCYRPLRGLISTKV